MTPVESSSLVARLARGGIELILFVLVFLAPWAFGSVHQLSLLILYLGIACCLLLWAVTLLVESRPPAVLCPVVVCLAAMVLLGIWQLTPLPSSLLRVVASGNERLWSELLPARPEMVAENLTVAEPVPTISLTPGATRDQVIKLLAVLSVFVLARYALPAKQSLKRLALVGVVNGALLSIFALTQHFSSPKEQLYWSIESTGAVFGPFICRNHFPFQVNVFVGLGLGLLLGRVTEPQKSREHWRDTLLRVASDPAAMWLVAALGLMLAANVYSQSRGGVLALVGAVSLCLIFRFFTSRNDQGAVLPIILLVAGIGVGLIGWFGVNRIEKRLQTIWSGDALGEGRARLWERTLPLAMEHPLWGTGYGTFDFIESSRREPQDASIFRFEYAHNEYLQTLLEGGIVHLALSLLAIGLVYRAIVAAYRRAGSPNTSAVILGAMIGFTTIVIHSFGDFGLHVPSIVLLTALLSGLLVSMGSPTIKSIRPAWQSQLLSVAIAVGCLLVALLLPLEGWKAERAERLRLASLRALARLTADQADPAITYLQAAVKYSPDNGLLWMQLAEAGRGKYEATEKQADSEKNCLLPALYAYQRARNVNPLLVEPHLWLGLYQGRMKRADAPEAYVNRATFLMPSDSRTWYLAGVVALREKQFDQAWSNWFRSLQCDPRFLNEVLQAISARPDAEEVFDRVLPDDFNLLYLAASNPVLDQFPNAKRKILLRAIDLAPSHRNAESTYRRAWLWRELDEPDKAIEELTQAVAFAQSQVEWRYELAELLFDAERFTEARKQLMRVLESRPNHPKAKPLLERSLRESRNRR